MKHRERQKERGRERGRKRDREKTEIERMEFLCAPPISATKCQA